jgi:SAM-dependent methyltransferase
VKSQVVVCAICNGSSEFVALRHGAFAKRDFMLYRCNLCGFIFIADPWTDYKAIYDECYYTGKGADPLVNYVSEINSPRSIRHLEWQGILRWSRAITEVTPATRWLDYGTGSGGLVNYVRRHGVPEAFGYDQSEASPKVAGHGATVLDDASLEGCKGSFNVVSCIEVIEHTPEPVELLRRIRQMLAPGGVLLVTTTNAQPYLAKLDSWRYITPEIHVSFFTPEVLATAMKAAGFDPRFPGYVDGWTDIIRYKVLKNVRRQNVSPFDALLAWPVSSRIIDRRLHLSAQPVGWVPEGQNAD